MPFMLPADGESPIASSSSAPIGAAKQKRMVTDWRNPTRWTMADRKRPCERASVSNVWTTNPFGVLPVEVLVAVQPGVWRKNGVPVGGLSSFNGALGARIDADADYSLISGQSIFLWQEGTQAVTAFDLTNPAVQAIWVEEIVAHFAWAQGIHADYFTNLAWLCPPPTIAAAFWTTWDQGWRDVCTALRAAKPGIKIVGQQWHLTPITDAVDGLFLEDSPGQFGLGFDDHRANMKTHGKPTEWVVELRRPFDFPEAYRLEVAAFARAQGCFLSWGRDATAGVQMEQGQWPSPN